MSLLHWLRARPGGSGAGVLTTDSGIAFTGDGRGNVLALDTSDGETLWQAGVGAPTQSSLPSPTCSMAANTSSPAAEGSSSHSGCSKATPRRPRLKANSSVSSFGVAETDSGLGFTSCSFPASERSSRGAPGVAGVRGPHSPLSGDSGHRASRCQVKIRADTRPQALR